MLLNLLSNPFIAVPAQKQRQTNIFTRETECPLIPIVHPEVPLLDGAQETFINTEVPPLDTRPPGAHEVTVAEVTDDTEQQLGRQGGDGHFVYLVCIARGKLFAFTNLKLNIYQHSIYTFN